MNTFPQSARLVRTASLFLLSFRLVAYFCDVPVAAAAPGHISIQSVQSADVFTPADFLTLTNEARTQNGFAPLQLNDELNAAAMAKAEDMASKGYWEHFRPSDNKAPWAFIEEAGYHYHVAGENLAKGYRTPNGITKAWIASPTHRANMLSPKYTEVGYACIEATMNSQRVLLTVQMFGAR
jgi:uncharacterized protein YkwD